MLRRYRTQFIVLVVGLALGVGLGIALNAGGWRTTESDRVREAATAYLLAFANDDPAALCASVSPLGRAQLTFGANSCEQRAQATIRSLPKAQRDALREPDVTVVSLAGDRAAVRFTPKLGDRADMQLIKLADQWLVNP